MRSQSDMDKLWQWLTHQTSSSSINDSKATGRNAILRIMDESFSEIKYSKYKLQCGINSVIVDVLKCIPITERSLNLASV